MARKTACVGLLVAALAVIAPASALADESLWPSGALTYAWHGDPSRGCAQVGVCGIRGVLIARPDDEVDSSSSGRRSVELDLSDASSSMWVRRSDPGSSGDCTDPTISGNDQPYALFVTFGAGRAVMATLGGAPSSGRCAGPLASDLAGLVLTGVRTLGPKPSFDLRGSVPFAAGPYSGTLTSTLTLKPYQPDDSGPNLSGSSGSGSGGQPPLIEQLDLRYRLSVAPSTLAVSFTGENDPFCAVFDSCATAGELSMALSGGHGTIDLLAQHVARHRLTRGQMLAEFRSGRLVVDPGFSFASENETLVESLTRPGAPTCADSRRLQDAVQLSLGPLIVPIGGRRVPVELISSGADNDGGGLDVLRTYCPGPSDVDVFGWDPESVLAHGSLSRAQLLEPTATLTLPASGSFGGPGYQGTHSGITRVVLALQSIQVNTYRGFGP